jgi:hypothetical protein
MDPTLDNRTGDDRRRLNRRRIPSFGFPPHLNRRRDDRRIKERRIN